MADRSVNPKRMVADGYDRIAEGYLRERTKAPQETTRAYLDRMTEGLASNAPILDLGCGAGVPHGAYLSERFDVVGADISRGQLGLARRLVPKATFVRADMCSLAFKPASFDAIVALYSIIHVPREEHEALLERLHDFLRPGGRLMVVLGARAWEGTETNWLDLGAEMFWSHFDADTGTALVERSGFRPLVSNIEPDPDGGAHLFLLAEKPR
jgi:SAM-dependent methyltransferase